MAKSPIHAQVMSNPEFFPLPHVADTIMKISGTTLRNLSEKRFHGLRNALYEMNGISVKTKSAAETVFVSNIQPFVIKCNRDYYLGVRNDEYSIKQPRPIIVIYDEEHRIKQYPTDQIND